MRQLFIAVLLLVLLMAGPVLAQTTTPPPGNIYPVAPFSTATHFVSVPCSPKFQCDAHYSDAQYLQIANECSNKRFGFPKEMLTYFVLKDTYANCAVPQSFIPKGDRFSFAAQWPICCVTPVGDSGQCRFLCHYYRSDTPK